MQNLRLSFIRHARPLVPKGYAYGGMENVPLNMTGPKTTAALREIADTLPEAFHAVSSPSPRALAATEAVLRLKHQDPAAIEINPHFLEQNWGDWQGLFYKDIPPAELAQYHADEDLHAPPGGESLNQLLKRVSEGMNDYTQAHKNGTLRADHVLVGCHGGVIRAAIAHAEGRKVSEILKQPVRRLSLTVMDYDHEQERWAILGKNLSLNTPQPDLP